MQNDNSLRQCFWLLPGHELDAFPKHLPSAEAAELLASWVGLWHPRLLVQLGGIPQWHSAAQAPETLSGSLLVIPGLARPELWCELATLEANSECLVLIPKSGWQEFQHQVLNAVNLSSADAAEDDLADELRFDFAALGYAYLQIQLMTRQLRYTSNLDQLLFSEQATSAAEAALDGDRVKAEELLQACFDTLGQERDHYYSLEVHLLEVILLAESTIGKSLRRQLESASPAASYLASAELLEQVKQLQPENFQRLQEQLSESACVVGGLSSERPHPLMPRDCFPRDLARGQAGYRGVGVEPPSVFARLSFGLTSDHAADLKRFGYSGALLIPWSGGKYPDGNQAKISWESSDGIYLSALATSVLDAADDASFLSLGWHVGQALDHQHVPSILFAHWAGKQSPYLQLLQIVARRTPALGRWMRADKYFQETDEPYHQERLSASAFRYNWLANSESPADLLAATQVLHRLWARSRSLLNLYNLSWQLEHVRSQATSAQSASQDPPGKADHALAEATPVDIEHRSDQSDASQTMAVKDEASPLEHVALPLSQLEHQLEQLIEVQDALLDAPADFKKQSESGFRLADQLTRDILKRLATQLVPGSAVQDPSSHASDKPESESSASGRLLLNPRSGPLRVRVRSDSERHFEEADWNYSSGRVGHDRYTCIDVPSTGFVFAPWTNQAPAARRDRNLAEGGGLVQNEFLEAQVDPTRGHLRSLHVPARRGNRLSVMVARRDRQGDGGFTYSEMVATDVRMLTSSNICGLVRATGRLNMAGQTVAHFEIDYETWRGSRILEVAIRLRDLKPLADANPWRSAFVVRVAWATESAILRTYNGGRRHSWSSGQTVAPALIEIDEAEYKTQYLTGGLAFHRRTEERFLETILAVDAQDVEQRVGFAVDLPQPLHTAYDFLDRRYSTSIHRAKPPQASRGWLISADVKNVLVDLERPLVDGQGRTVGVRLFLTETAGKSTNTRIRMPHNIAAARRVDFHGNNIGKLTTKEDAFTIVLRASEQCQVDLLWA